MKPYLVKTPKIVQRAYPKRIWNLSNSLNTVYLTFDDGPIPEVTPWVLKTLKNYNAKATFFCIGDNASKHPEVLHEVIKNGHSIGNHTHNHINGWNTKTNEYLENSLLLKNSINAFKDVHLFRPPYGKLTSAQSKKLQKEGFKIIMWDVLSADFDQNISKEKCLDNVLKNIKSGSIVVFHDSLKAEKKLKYVLPKILDHINIHKWKCASIN